MLKTAIIASFLLLLASLVSGFVFLQKDQGATKRTAYALGFRLFFTATLLSLIIYGLYSGELSIRNPKILNPAFSSQSSD